MEKLIELLNEYETLKVGVNPRTILGDGTMYCDCLPGLETLYGELICGKPYGFIQWLVDNDKIDTDPIRTRVKRVYIELEPRELTPQDFTDRLIMLLSISDTPIDDLISYLK